MTTTRRRGRTTLSSGPWTGVRSTTDPFDDAPSLLTDARNGYIPDPSTPSGWYARPGFSLLFGGDPIYSSGTDFRAAGGYCHVGLDGTATNLLAIAGYLLRIDETFTTATDVTPVDVTIDASITTRVTFKSLAGQLIVSDGVTAPWIASNLGSTPITGTPIDFDGSGTAWSAQHMAVYSGGLLVLLNELGGTYAQTDIAWSAPGDPATGYQQPTYDYRWTLEQTGSKPIRAVHGTNSGCYYFREGSIGLAVGALGPDFQTTHTDDAVAENIGTLSPQAIVGFTDRLFFLDAIGRPWMIPLGGRPVPIWQQMRSVIDAAPIFNQAVTAVTSTASFESTLNLYCVAIWSTNPARQTAPSTWYVFDAGTGTYLGHWDIASATGGSTTVELLCSFQDGTGRSVMMAFGSKASAPAVGGYGWSINTLRGSPIPITSEGGMLITQESGDTLTTEGQDNIWTDNDVTPAVAITTGRMGYADGVVWRVDQATVTTTSASPVTVALKTSTLSETLEGTPTPAASQDGTYRCVVGTDAMGRGTQVITGPTTTAAQWSVQRVSIVAIPSNAGVEDA